MSDGDDGHMSQPRSVRICDCSLRDGQNAIAHQLTPAQVSTIAARLDDAGVYAIEVGHGDGLAASSVHFGRALARDDELLSAAAGAIRRAALAFSAQPGIATQDDLRAAADLGATVAKIATHCTEADIGIQHVRLARKLGLRTCGGLMMSHMVEPGKLVENAQILADAGAQVVYVADSAGALTMDGVRRRISAVREALEPDVEIAIHAHNNLSLAVANTVVAVEEGATVADACLAGFGAGAGNCQLEALVAVLERMGIATGVDLWKAEDAADEVVRPIMTEPPTVNGVTISLGYAGIYSSFLLHTYRAAERLGVEPRDVLVELGRCKVVAGQEDVIIDVATSLAGRKPARGRS